MGKYCICRFSYFVRHILSNAGGNIRAKVLLVLLGVCFCSGLVLAYLQNSKPVLIAVNYGQEEVSREEYARIVTRLIGNNKAE